MAFGTWLKKTFNKVKDFTMNKALPAIRKGVSFVGKVAAPVGKIIGGAIGGPIGGVISGVTQKMCDFAGGGGGGTITIDMLKERLRNFQPVLKDDI